MPAMSFIMDRTFIHRTSGDGTKPVFIEYAGNVNYIKASIALTGSRYRKARENALRKLGAYATASLYQSNCNAKHCLHCVYEPVVLKRHGDFAGATSKRFVVACDPEHTNVVDDCMECFTCADGTLVLRVHLALPETLNCTSEADRGARVATVSAFVARNLNESVATYLFDRTHEGNYTKGGFVEGVARVALTVESIFDPVKAAEGYRLNQDRSSVYVSRVTLTKRVTDEQLYQLLCPAEERGITAETAAALRADHDAPTRAALSVLTRIYRLAKGLGWGSGTLFNRCSTTPVYGNDSNVVRLLRQRFNPDYHAVVTQFCFRHLVSEAVFRLAHDYASTHDGVCLPLVCRFPCGACVPALTEGQAQVLRAQGCGNDLAAGVPTAARWRRVCVWATKRGVPLLQMFADLGTPLVGASGGEIAATSARYTTALQSEYHCYAISNKPMRDYTCLVNARCAVGLVRKLHSTLDVDGVVFDAWVAYWDEMQRLVAWGRRELVAGMLQCHMRRAFGICEAEVRTCVMEARVCGLLPDGGLSVVFPTMNRIVHQFTWRPENGKRPALGSPVLFSVRSRIPGAPDIRYIPNALIFAAKFSRHYVPELQKPEPRKP